MLIKYNKANVHTLTTSDGKGSMWLKPGINEFPDHIWNENKAHPHVVDMMNNNEIELFKEEDVGIKPKGKVQKDQPRYLGQGDQPVRLCDIPDDKSAIEIVKATYDKNLLQRWMDEETRSKVKRELDKQLKSVMEERTSEH